MKNNRFIYSIRNITTKSRIIQQYEIGIILKESPLYYTVNFVVENSIENIKKTDVTIFDPQKTGDSFPKKVCNVCHKLLSTSHFQKNQNGKGNRTIRRPSCNSCRKLIDGESVSATEKKTWEKNKPNMEIFECPICKKRTIPGLTSKIVLDHNHHTGKVRGWICDSCNTGIGRFKDDAKLLEEAIKYLQKTN